MSKQFHTAPFMAFTKVQWKGTTYGNTDIEYAIYIRNTKSICTRLMIKKVILI